MLNMSTIFFYHVFNDKHLSSFYHYTSFESLFYILNSGHLHINALTGMNDRSDVDFVNNHMGKTWENPYHYLTTAYHNAHFIFCLTEAKDQLNQWRLYGDDANGVMIEFTVERPKRPQKCAQTPGSVIPSNKPTSIK